jgi:hypothetical protein
MIEIAFSPSFKRAFKRKTASDPNAAARFWERVETFKDNPFHPSLRTHKLSGKCGPNLYRTWSRQRMRPSRIPRLASGFTWLIQDFSHSANQGVWDKGLLDKVSCLFRHSLLDNGAVGVTRHIQHLHFGSESLQSN